MRKYHWAFVGIYSAHRAKLQLIRFAAHNTHSTMARDHVWNITWYYIRDAFSLYNAKRAREREREKAQKKSKPIGMIMKSNIQFNNWWNGIISFDVDLSYEHSSSNVFAFRRLYRPNGENKMPERILPNQMVCFIRQNVLSHAVYTVPTYTLYRLPMGYACKLLANLSSR